LAPVRRQIVLNHVSHQRTPFDEVEYERRTREGPCFIRAIADADPDYRGATAMVYEDSDVLIFLNRYPTLRGYTLLCPRRHVESVVAGFTEPEYLELQQWIYRVGRAVERVVPTERLYILSLSSQQGNRHVHWHIAPLPPDVPYPEQQLAALAMSRGVLSIPADEMARLAREIREELLRGA
jgi:diadenosine tetraphosphate (Ap4A) HIT family hydrolase